MKPKNIVAVSGGLVVVLVIALAFWRLPGGGASEGVSNDASTQSMDGMAGMSDMAGMDMGGPDAGGSVRLSNRDISTFGITFGSAELRGLQRTVRAVGLVEFDETRMAYVSTKVGGWAEHLYVDFAGQAVRQGQPLLEIYSPALVTAQEELLLAADLLAEVSGTGTADVSGASELFASARRQLEYWDISPAQIDALLASGEVRRTLTLHAPTSGIVMEKDIFRGEAFEAGRNLYMIADLSEVWVTAEVFEADIPWVREGMPAEVVVEALPGRPFTGRVEYVYPTLSDRTRAMRARVSLPNSGGLLKPGMYATVRLAAALGEALTLPASAVLRTGERAVAFVDMGGGSLMPHELQLGIRGDEFVQVLAGVEAGHQVVTSAQFLLDSESNLAEVMRGMMAQMNMSDMGGMDMSEPMGPADSTGGR